MSEFLGLGITHYPGLVLRSPRPGSLTRVLKDPGLPQHLRSPNSWPEKMRLEWGDDNGAKFAVEHREAIVQGMRKARKALDDFQPDVVVIWGDDQYENFREDIVPAFCILAYESVEVKPWSKPGAPANVWSEPPETTVKVRGHKQAAKQLASGLLEAGFDMAYSYRPLHDSLGHAFLNSVLYLDWDRRGFDYPVVPFSINCYGRRIIALQGYMESLDAPVKETDLDPPSPSPSRCLDLGAACVRALRDTPWRVALVASSSWSHAFLTKKHFYLYPDTAADRELYGAMKVGNYSSWRRWTLPQIEESGQQELLNWFCLIGAMSELGRTPAECEFIESSIMNSNKVFATFLP